MTYFVVLLLFLAWLVVSFIALIVLRVKWPEWRGRFYFFHAVLWSSLGILVANALLIVGLWLGFPLIDSSNNPQSIFQNLVRAVWGVSAIIGPLLASAGGWGIGILVGLVVAYRRGKIAFA